jgi:hypothetical protein
MEIRIKKNGLFIKRIEGKTKIDDVIIKEDLLNPEKARIFVYFKGKNESGILAFEREELDKLTKAIKPGLPKGIKTWK